MYRILQLLLVALVLLSSTTDLDAQRRSRSSGSTYKPQNSHSSKPYKSPTYNLGGTKYKSGETYKTTGQPKVERSTSAKKEFLKERGYKRTPSGYEVDHVTPLSKGGADKPYNMQLLPKEVHKQKTAGERRRR